MSTFVDYTGKRFHLLLVLERVQDRGGSVMWRCLCDCGKEKIVRAGNLRTGNTKSCGHRIAESTRARCITHGQSIGYKSTPEHRAWKQALNRCRNTKLKNWKDYGGRGIKMCPEWEASFQSFFDHIGTRPTPNHSLDRIDNDKGYQPGNVRWATKREQVLNRRTRKPIMVNGVPMKVREAAKIFGLNAKTVRHRLWRGYSDEDALKPSLRGRT